MGLYSFEKMKNLIQKLNSEITNIVQRISDWYTTTIGHNLRTTRFLQRYIEGSVLIERDPLDISPSELEAMRRRFDRVIGNYL